MNEQVFWKMIGLAQEKSHGDLSEQLEQLFGMVADLAVPHIFRFDKVYYWLLDKANEADLWAAGYVLADGCDAQEFVAFRNWLMLQGQLVFKRAIEDPETLVAFAPMFNRQPNAFFAAARLSTLAQTAYTYATGRFDYLNIHPYALEPTKLRGELWADNFDLVDRLPSLCHAMGWGNELRQGNWLTDE